MPHLSENKIRFLITVTVLIVVSIFAFRQPAVRSIPNNPNKADFLFQDFSIKNFNGDKLESEISAQQAEIHKKSLKVSIINPHTQISPNTPDQIEISAKTGNLYFFSNKFDFENATVRFNFAQQPTTIVADQVSYFPKKNKITGKNSVEVANPLYTLKGKQFEFDTAKRYLKVNSQVSGKIKATQ